MATSGSIKYVRFFEPASVEQALVLAGIWTLEPDLTT